MLHYYQDDGETKVPLVLCLSGNVFVGNIVHWDIAWSKWLKVLSGYINFYFYFHSSSPSFYYFFCKVHKNCSLSYKVTFVKRLFSCKFYYLYAFLFPFRNEPIFQFLTISKVKSSIKQRSHEKGNIWQLWRQESHKQPKKLDLLKMEKSVTYLILLIKFSIQASKNGLWKSFGSFLGFLHISEKLLFQHISLIKKSKESSNIRSPSRRFGSNLLYLKIFFFGFLVKSLLFGTEQFFLPT